MRCLAICLIFFVLACSGPEGKSKPADTIHYYQFSLPRDREAFSQLIDQFHTEHPGYHVQFHTLPTTSDDQHQFYLTHASSTGNSRIDVFAADIIWLAELARAGVLMPVGEIFAEPEWAEFFSSSVRAATFQGKRYGIPYFVDAGMLYSRKDLLEKHGYTGPPETWRELVAMAQDILQKENEPALKGLVWQGKQYEGLICNFLEFLPGTASLSRGGNSPIIFDQPQVRQAIQFMRDLVVTHRISPMSVFAMSEEESRQVFQNGSAIFMRNWPYAWRLAQQEGSPIAGKVWVSALPSLSETGTGHGALGGFLLGINQKTPYPEVARAWVRFLVRPQTQKILWNQLGLTPARKSVFPQLAAKGFPLDVLENVLSSAVPRPVMAMYNPISQSMQAYISGALVGAYSIDRAVRLIDSDVKRIMRVLDG